MQSVRILGALAALLTGTLLAGAPLRADPAAEEVAAAVLTSPAVETAGARPAGGSLFGAAAGPWRRSLLELDQPVGEESELRLRVQPKVKQLVVLEFRF